MSAANITFIGGKDAGTITWGGIEFPADKAILVDPNAADAGDVRSVYEHIIAKARNNPHFKVEEVKGKAAKAEEAEQPAEDYPEIPTDWRDLHHTSMIALANKLGADVSTRDDAAAFIEKYVELDEPSPGSTEA